MSSGGLSKEKYDEIYIEAPEVEAKVIFYNRFGHNPERVSCTCCGGDYSISESPTLEQASGFHRGCRYAYRRDYSQGYIEEPDKGGFKKYQTLKEYVKNKDVLVIRAKDIKPEERKGEVPEQGYVWQD